jgi:hypothetical protein
MRYSLVVHVGVLTAAVLVVLALCGCEAKREDGRREEFVGVLTTHSLDASSRTDAVEILLGAEKNVCAIYPDDIPELFVDKTFVHKVYWRALGQHSFTIYAFTTWPFYGTAAPINVPQGGRSEIYYVDPSTAGGNVSYKLTYDNPPQSCTSYIPDQGAMRIHITK